MSFNINDEIEIEDKFYNDFSSNPLFKFKEHLYFCSNEYINATKINGGEPMGRQWIVTQGPLNTTIEVNSNCYCSFAIQFLLK